MRLAIWLAQFGVKMSRRRPLTANETINSGHERLKPCGGQMAVLIQRYGRLGVPQGPADRQDIAAGLGECDRGERVPEPVDVDPGDPLGSTRIRPGDAADQF